MKYSSNPALISLLKNLSPQMHQGEYVYCHVAADYQLKGREAVATFMENEGKTLVIEKSQALANELKFESSMCWITLNVYSSLESVGLTAAISQLLAENNISCNVIAAFHHDHLFIPAAEGPAALKLLTKLSESFL